MIRLLVVYCSSFGNIEPLAYATAAGARGVGAAVDVRRVPQSAKDADLPGTALELDQQAPLASITELESYQAIIVGTGSRFGRMPSPLGAFLEQAHALRHQGALAGRVGGVFTASGGPQHGFEATGLALMANLINLGMIIVGAPDLQAGSGDVEDSLGDVLISAQAALERARRHGALVAEVAQKLFG